MIKIARFGDVRFDSTVYVGRPGRNYEAKFDHAETVLGNPYRLEGRSDEARAKCVEKYRLWLFAKIQEQNAPVMAALDRLLARYEKYGRLVLVCHCINTEDISGHYCHAQVIARALMWLRGRK